MELMVCNILYDGCMGEGCLEAQLTDLQKSSFLLLLALNRQEEAKLSPKHSGDI